MRTAATIVGQCEVVLIPSPVMPDSSLGWILGYPWPFCPFGKPGFLCTVSLLIGWGGSTVSYNIACLRITRGIYPWSIMVLGKPFACLGGARQTWPGVASSGESLEQKGGG